MMAAMTDYALELDAIEISRYRMMAAHAKADEASQWAAAGIAPGARVADVGCGPGAITALLADAVAPTGSVVGVDGNAGTVAAARELTADAGVTNVDFQVAPAEATGLAAGSFDVVMLRHVLAHNGGREQAIVDHLAALARPDGIVYVVDVDLTATKLYPVPADLVDLGERYVRFHRQLGNNPEIGLGLRQLLTTAGLEMVDYTGRYAIIPGEPGMRPPSWAARDAMMAAGLADQQDVERWRVAFELLDGEPQRPFIFASMFTALARRPS
jgi:SAM-dependent methyltransferase